MPHYDFIEIGTSNFNTLIETATENMTGISVEPIKHYLDQLPNRKRVKKINVAVSFDNIESLIDLFYIPEKIIKENKLDKWLVGCNSIGDYHYQHIKQNLQRFVKIEKIKQVPIEKIFLENDVTTLTFLKLDLEGGDTKVLTHLYNFLSKNKKYDWPKKIQFESNSLTTSHDVQKIINLYSKKNYKLLKRNKKDTVIIRNYV